MQALGMMPHTLAWVDHCPCWLSTDVIPSTTWTPLHWTLGAGCWRGRYCLHGAIISSAVNWGSKASPYLSTNSTKL